MNVLAHYDLDNSRKLCSGIISVDNKRITASEAGKTVFSAELDGVSEMIIRTYNGCAEAEIAFSDSPADSHTNRTVCRFTMSCIEEIGELCKVVNHYIASGEENEISTEGFRVCPKCGRHYAKGMSTCLFCVEKSYIAKKLYTVAKPYLKMLLLAGILITLSSGFTALVPILNAKLVDGYLYNIPADKAAAISGIGSLALLMALTQIISRVFGIFGQRKANKVSTSLSNDLRLMVYDKIQRLSVSSISDKTSGDLMKRVTGDTEKVKNFITEQGLYLVEKITLFIVILIILLSISPLLTFIVLVPVPLVSFAISRFWKRIHYKYERQWRCASRENSILHDIIKGIRVVKTFGSEDREISKFSAASKRLADVSVSNERLWALTFPFLTFFMGIGEFLVLYFGGRMAINETITVGQLLEFNLFLAYIYEPLRWMTNLPRRLADATTSLIKIFEILDEKDEITDCSEPSPANLSGDIVFSNVQFGYKPYEPVLKNINLHVKQGEMIGLVGHSGAGKSTLINLVMRLYDTDSGSISIGGVDIKNMDQHEFRSKIGVVFQETFLFNGSVYDNIAYARPDASPSEIIASAKAANAHKFIMDLPDGYNTIVGEDGHNLSGGERQRISIARAVLRNPEILILDEATSALDPETEEAIQEALARLVKGRTTFAIAHRLATLRNADRLVVIEKGRIAETGTHNDLLKQKGIYSNLVMAQRQTSKLVK